MENQALDMATKMPTPPANPLLNYYRQPKIFIRLPSNGKYYPEGSLDVSETGEYPVYAMTAKDELILKTPDALMSGQSTVEVIKSCIPAIVNPWFMPSIDLDTALIAIRIATYGETMDITAICPKCKEENTYQLNLVDYLEKVANFKYKDTVDCDPLIIHIKPYSYKELTKSAIKALEQEKIFSIINNEEMSEDEKIDRFGESFLKLTDLTVGMIVNSIIKISTPDGDVTDIDQIKAFMNNAEKSIFNKIKKQLEELKEQLEIKTTKTVCSNHECLYEYNVEITLDQSSFFDQGSSN